MAVTQKILKFKSQVRVGDNTITKKYTGISDSHWTRITRAARELADAGIFPLREIVDSRHEIVMDHVTLFDNSNEPPEVLKEYVNMLLGGSRNYICTKNSNGADVIDLPVGDQPTDNQKVAEIISQVISRLVEVMHSVGYAHGDLHINNIGYYVENPNSSKFSGGLPPSMKVAKVVRFYILDLDTAFPIANPPAWVADWMKSGFEWDGTYSEFVEYDFENWRTDWLSC